MTRRTIWNTPLPVLKNKAISFLYDPGSTFKIVLAASALENRACGRQETFDCHNGVYAIRDRQIIDVHPFARLSFDDIIIQSSNIGAAQIGMRLGGDKYFQTIGRFGFGRRTGILLPAEENGILNPPQKWSGVSLAFLSFGYEIAVTPLQMATAFNVPASGGFLVRPEILRAGTPGGERPAGALRRLPRAADRDHDRRGQPRAPGRKPRSTAWRSPARPGRPTRSRRGNTPGAMFLPSAVFSRPTIRK